MAKSYGLLVLKHIHRHTISSSCIRTQSDGTPYKYIIYEGQPKILVCSATNKSIALCGYYYAAIIGSDKELNESLFSLLAYALMPQVDLRGLSLESIKIYPETLFLVSENSSTITTPNNMVIMPNGQEGAICGVCNSFWPYVNVKDYVCPNH